MRFSKELRRLLIGGLLVLTAASLSACGASKEDPWSYGASFSQDILISSDPGETLFTGDEWTGKTFARDAQGSFVSMSDIVRINTLDYHTVGTVVYDSVEKPLAKLALQILNLPRERRLGDMKEGSCVCDAPLSCYGQKIPENS